MSQLDNTNTLKAIETKVSSLQSALQTLPTQLGSLQAFSNFTGKFITAPSLTILMTLPGTLHSFVISKPSMPSLTIIDGGVYPGATIFEGNAGLPIGTYLFDSAFTTGLSFLFTNAGQAPSISVSYK